MGDTAWEEIPNLTRKASITRIRLDCLNGIVWSLSTCLPLSSVLLETSTRIYQMNGTKKRALRYFCNCGLSWWNRTSTVQWIWTVEKLPILEAMCSLFHEGNSNNMVWSVSSIDNVAQESVIREAVNQLCMKHKQLKSRDSWMLP